ncbi:serine/threonine protein kinase [Streptomyces antibioticus]|uniref:serine/threonine-protein kinase n=1 Tax=Streptomyces antibioticus TaxID=1890 RepID=UPI0022519011|nr:serine/threonine-protein kinase [Streptomyces antibioticus]MCX5172316.1 serine/threonine protein kinase [Streptomyces antibioticus]
MKTWSVPGFREIRELGAGGSGRVVLAVETATGTRVAIKYLSQHLLEDARFRREFRAEARLLQEIASPHVAHLRHYIEVPHGVAMVLELVDGPTLRVLLRQEGATVPEAALTVLKGSLLGLGAAHRQGIVHRDYKPENVLITTDAVSKLVDFGIAARGGSTPSAVAGTPPYMAPEQWQGRSPTAATDVYAATVTFFECVTGFRPYGGDSVAEIATGHLTADVPAWKAPEPVRPLVLRGMAKDPAERFASVDEFLDALEAMATAGYGPDWEERGRRSLASLVVALLMNLSRPRTGEPGATTELATTETTPEDAPTDIPDHRTAPGVRSSRASRRTPVVIGGAAALLVVATAAGVLANRPSANDAAHATPAFGTSSGTSAPPVGTADSSPGGPTPRHAPTHDSAPPSPPAPGTTRPKETNPGGGDASGTPGGTPRTTAPLDDDATMPSAAPPASASGVAMRVSAVHITSLKEAAPVRGAEATVTVTTTRPDPVTLELTWYDSDQAGVPGARNGSTEVYRLSGRTTYRLTTRHEFTTCPAYWGLRARSTPAALSGDIYQDMGALACILQPRG